MDWLKIYFFLLKNKFLKISDVKLCFYNFFYKKIMYIVLKYPPQ